MDASAMYCEWNLNFSSFGHDKDASRWMVASVHALTDTRSDLIRSAFNRPRHGMRESSVNTGSLFTVQAKLMSLSDVQTLSKSSTVADSSALWCSTSSSGTSST